MDLLLDDLKQIATLSPDLALVEAAPLLKRIARDHALLDNAACPTGSVPGNQCLHSDSSLNLQLCLWPAATWTPIHDHTSWAVYLCIAGTLMEDRYARLDDGSRSGTARLRREWRSLWRPGQHSGLLPYAAGIHCVGNPSDRPAVSLHLYGPRLSHLDGRDYDPRRDFVCDRPVDLAA